MIFLLHGMGGCAVNGAWTIEWLILCYVHCMFHSGWGVLLSDREKNQSFLPRCIIWYTAFGKFLTFLTVFWTLSKSQASAAKLGQPQLQLGGRTHSCKHSFIMFKDVRMAFFSPSPGFSLCSALKRKVNWWIGIWLCLGWVEDAKKHCHSTF